MVEAHAEGMGVLQGVASLGVRPTLKHDAQPVLEVHLFEFEQNIYGKRLRVEFLQKLRDEVKYRCGRIDAADRAGCSKCKEMVRAT